MRKSWQWTHFWTAVVIVNRGVRVTFKNKNKAPVRIFVDIFCDVSVHLFFFNHVENILTLLNVNEKTKQIYLRSTCFVLNVTSVWAVQTTHWYMSKLMSNENRRPMSQFTWQYTDTLKLTEIVSDLTLLKFICRHSSKIELPTSVVTKWT